MKNLRLQILLFSLVFLFSEAKNAFAQQLPHYSQYIINDYVLNPAIGGSNDYFEAKSNHRYQWIGITDAPRTYIMSINGPISSQKMGVGGYVIADRTGPTSKLGIYGSYAYHFNVADEVKLSLGIFGGILQYNVDGSQITFADNDDPVLNDNIESIWLPDAGFGAYLYAEKYYFGASVPQLFNNKLDIFKAKTNGLSRLKSHLFVMGGYKLSISDNLVIEPSLLMKVVIPAPAQFDISLRGIYNKLAWLGFTFRTDDAMSFLLGYTYQEKLFFGYSYDFTTSEIRNYSSGTHEFMIGMRFHNKNKEVAPLIE